MLIRNFRSHRIENLKSSSFVIVVLQTTIHTLIYLYDNNLSMRRVSYTWLQLFIVKKPNGNKYLALPPGC
jgi:hypothetical protein